MAGVVGATASLLTGQYGQQLHGQQYSLTPAVSGIEALTNMLKSHKLIREITSMVNTKSFLGGWFDTNKRPFGLQSEWSSLKQLNEGGQFLSEMSLLPPAQAPGAIKPRVRPTVWAKSIQLSELAMQINPSVGVASWVGTMKLHIMALRKGTTLDMAQQLWTDEESVLATVKTTPVAAVGGKSKVIIKDLYGYSCKVGKDEAFPIFRRGLPLLFVTFTGGKANKPDPSLPATSASDKWKDAPAAWAVALVHSVSQNSDGDAVILLDRDIGTAILADSTIFKWSGSLQYANASGAVQNINTASAKNWELAQVSDWAKGYVGVMQGFKTSGHLYGINVADEPLFQGNQNSLTADLTQDDLHAFFDAADIYSGDDGGAPSVMISNHKTRRLYLATFADQKRYMSKEQVGKGGYNAIEFMGMGWLWDKRCPPERIFRLALKNFLTAEVCAPRWLQRDTPSIFRQSGNRAVWQATMWGSRQYVNKMPNAHYMLDQVKDH